MIIKPKHLLSKVGLGEENALPTDLDILGFIYDCYYDDFCRYDDDENIRDSKMYVPIDCEMIAEHFGVNGDIIFGRLYHHLEQKYKFVENDPSNKKIISFFALGVGKDSKCINFPYMVSVLSDLQLYDKRHKQMLIASGLAVVVSLLSLGINIF